MAEDLPALLERLESLLAAVDAMEEPARTRVFELLDGIDTLHRSALHHLGDALGDEQLVAARDAHPAIAWLCEAYGIGVDERHAAEQALEAIRPYVDSHGGDIQVLDAHEGVVTLRMAGACAGCSASAVTLQEGVEEALQKGMPGFVRIEVQEDADAAPHPPPGATLDGVSPPPGATLLQVLPQSP